MTPPAPIRPDGDPTRIVEEGVGKDPRSGVVLTAIEGRISTRGIFSYRMLPPREQGDFGERAALCWLVAQGAHVSIPFGHSPHYDLIADFDGRLGRVQVKTSACRQKERWSVTVCTRGGNQSWSGLVKRLDSERFDFLFVLVADGRQWFIPADRVEGGRGILLGGPKYAEFEVERGDPIPGGTFEETPSTIAS